MTTETTESLLDVCMHLLCLNDIMNYANELNKNDWAKKITNVKELFGAHSCNDDIKHFGDEILTFHNFSNCAEKFDNILYPRRKDQIDTHAGIDVLPGKYAVVIVSLPVFNWVVDSRTLSIAMLVPWLHSQDRQAMCARPAQNAQMKVHKRV